MQPVTQQAGGVDDYTDNEHGYRREVNTVRKTWRWAKGSGEFRNFKTGDSFNTLTKYRQEAAIQNGQLYKQRKTEAAKKRATLNR